MEYGILSATDQRFSDDLNNSEFGDAELTIETDASGDLPITVAALVPASHQSEIEQDSVSAPRPSNVDEVVASEVRAQALKAELGKANIKLEEARRYKEQAERAREQLEVEASETLRTERQRLTEDADKAKQQLDEAKALKAELAKAKDDAKKQAAELEKKRIADLEEANRQAEEARQLKKELAQAKRDAAEQAKNLKLKEKTELAEANAQLEEARRLKDEAESATRRVDEEVADRLRLAQERLTEEARRAKAVLDGAQRIKEAITQQKRPESPPQKKQKGSFKSTKRRTNYCAFEKRRNSIANGGDWNRNLLSYARR